MVSLRNTIQMEMNKAGEKIKRIDEGKRMTNEIKERKIQKIVDAYRRKVKNLENDLLRKEEDALQASQLAHVAGTTRHNATTCIVAKFEAFH